ncbi:dihydrolipoyl dehydrogenase [Natrarchaeobius chitinivorans]|uniref:Dihydrolipoyl dehydrogenase n=1 Tax=Natrarchaeobius chitinivorans TaxID=1679083 RepID=A0A3N6MC25_NATCH|nr:dihydrolipoyl dehydrogenase [Natrarchaeobius chitinivorans]RQG94060.1 dihydrolipoyl dehydrogenase [Natrarchaeobius chitinivorans]
MTEYDVVVIGGGSGSQVATAAADSGLEAAVIERGPLGGACITRGCVPSKALIHRADVAEELRRAPEVGLEATLEGVAYGEFTASIRDWVYEKAARQERSLEDADSVALYRGEGRFVDERTVAIDPNGDGSGENDPDTIRGDHVVVAVGSRPLIPPIDGLEDVEFLTSDDALFLDEQPDSLVIVGGGYIGAELGYFFAALGTDVSLIGRSDVLVPREDGAVSEFVTESLEGYCDVYTGHEASSVESTDGGVVVTAERTENGDGGDESGNGTGEDESGNGTDEDESVDLEADRLLLATGRRPNTDTLDLEQTGVKTDDRGYVETDSTLETTCHGVWALGDVLGEQPYKHAADYETQVVSANVLEACDGLDADVAREVDYDAMPHAIFTSPQVASVGATEEELEETDREYESATVPFDVAPLGVVLETDGFVKALASPDGEILGCHVVGPQASILIQEVVVAMERGEGTVEDVAEPVHVHPALSEVVYAAFDELSTNPYSTAPDWRDVGG